MLIAWGGVDRGLTRSLLIIVPQGERGYVGMTVRIH